MSATDLSTPLSSPSPTPAGLRPAAARASGVIGTWLRVALVCGILLGSLAVRNWQGRRIEAYLTRTRFGPRIDLEQIPMKLGPWDGTKTELDPMIARGTGADQAVTRHYVNHDTGAAIDVILLYGPAVNMYTHSPEVCYPAAGFATLAGPSVRTIKTGEGGVPFKSLVYSRGEGGVSDLQEVYYTWWYNGRWTPNVGPHKDFERIPNMYKVHLARRVTSAEKRDVGNPCELFLHELMPDMERRMSETQSPAH
jgi:EpsI family protein